MAHSDLTASTFNIYFIHLSTKTAWTVRKTPNLPAPNLPQTGRWNNQWFSRIQVTLGLHISILPTVEYQFCCRCRLAWISFDIHSLMDRRRDAFTDLNSLARRKEKNPFLGGRYSIASEQTMVNYCISQIPHKTLIHRGFKSLWLGMNVYARATLSLSVCGCSLIQWRNIIPFLLLLFNFRYVLIVRRKRDRNTASETTERPC